MTTNVGNGSAEGSSSIDPYADPDSKWHLWANFRSINYQMLRLRWPATKPGMKFFKDPNPDRKSIMLVQLTKESRRLLDYGWIDAVLIDYEQFTVRIASKTQAVTAKQRDSLKQIMQFRHVNIASLLAVGALESYTPFNTWVSVIRQDYIPSTRTALLLDARARPGKWKSSYGLITWRYCTMFTYCKIETSLLSVSAFSSAAQQSMFMNSARDAASLNLVHKAFIKSRILSEWIRRFRQTRYSGRYRQNYSVDILDKLCSVGSLDIL